MRPYNMHTLTNINMQCIERNVMECRYKIQSRNLPNLVVIQHVEYPKYILDKQFSLILHISEIIICNLDHTMVNVFEIARVIIF